MKINLDKQWWNNLDKIWKDELISNLLDSPGYEGKKLDTTEIYKRLEISDEIITDIVNLEKLHISQKLIFDLSPLFYLKKINDFHIQPPNWKEPNFKFLYLYPKHLRSKVKRLDLDSMRVGESTPLGDFTVFEEFENLEYLQIQSCHFESLEGIQKLKKLKVLDGGMNNHFSDLEPLRGLGLVSLDLEWTNVTDISSLIDVPSLEWLNLNKLHIEDYSVLLQLPNLKTVIFTGWEEVPRDKLEKYLEQINSLPSAPTKVEDNPNFKMNKKWYLLPFDPSDPFFGSVQEGEILTDSTAFKKHNSKGNESRIVIADFIGLCTHLSATDIFPVKLPPDTLVNKIDNHSWYASKVEILKPVVVWQLMRSSFHNIHPGTINFKGQTSLPEKVQLPTVVYGDLVFSGNLLPTKLSLPIKVKGELRFESCTIPDNLRLTYEVDHIVFLKCTLNQSRNFDFKNSPKISFQECDFSDKFSISSTPLWRLTFKDMKIPNGLELPDKFTGNLEFTDCEFPNRYIFPSRINGSLTIKFPKSKVHLKLPSYGAYELYVSEENELANYDIPESVKVTVISDELPF